MSVTNNNLEDLLVQGGRPEGYEARHVNMPIELGSTMVFDTLSAFEEARDKRHLSETLFYGRYGNSASFQLEKLLTELEHASGVTLTSSGVAAISLSLLALVKPGSHLLVADNVYGNTRTFCETVLQRLQVQVEFFDPLIGAEIGTLFRSNTAAIMFEAPGSGTFEFPDIVGITRAARQASVITVIDGTWATPVFCQPLTLGADVLVYSVSKYICGHSDCMSGVIASGNANIHQIIRQFVLAIGDKTGGQEIFLALRGLRTLNMRMQAVDLAGKQMAQWFKQQPQVKRVLHPALSDCPGHEYWQRDCTGAAGLFAVVFHPCSDQQLAAFVDTLKHFGIGVSWGGFESLVLPVTPVRTATQWTEAGQLVRFNIGFDDPVTLQKDLTNAMIHLNTE